MWKTKVSSAVPPPRFSKLAKSKSAVEPVSGLWMFHMVLVSVPTRVSIPAEPMAWVMLLNVPKMCEARWSRKFDVGVVSGGVIERGVVEGVVSGCAIRDRR